MHKNSICGRKLINCGIRCEMFCILIAAFMMTQHCVAQAVLSRGHLDSVRENLDRPMYAEAYVSLIADADSLLMLQPLSVMMKKRQSPSGDNHDYVSLARYFHPDPASPDGLPYVNRDGLTNPEISLWDRENFGLMSDRVMDLSLAWFFSHDGRYAAKAAEQLRCWFLDPDTKMNPNFEYAQMVPGVNGWKGRPFGVLDGYSLVGLLDGVALLDGSGAWSAEDDRRLKEWMGAMLDWMLDSPQGQEESRQANNHSTAYDVEVVALAIYTGRLDLARGIIESFPSRRIFTQIAPDGTQPHEMWRTLSFGYSQYNLSHYIDLFLMADKLGIRIDSETDQEGRSFYRGLDFLVSFLGKDVKEWPGKQISSWEEKQQALARDLWRVASSVDPARCDYVALYRRYRRFDPAERFTLTYYVPDMVDDVFVNAATSLRNMVESVMDERMRPANHSEGKVNPRTTNPDGSLVLVHPHDWTSGFFPGELWMMYDFTNDPWWRDRADTFSRDIEMAKNHGGTHDLGFMIGDSFGKGWELTGNDYYLDVMLQASATLATRFNPVVGAIRSWDHNPEEWKYPVIIDNMMNLEMLFNATNVTCDSTFRDIAISHADVTLRNHFRDDHSCFHVVDYSPVTGEPRMKVTAQGYSDDSFWSRGQAWALYGFTMCYRFTRQKRYLDRAEEVVDWFLSLPGLPDDLVPYWDMKAPGTEISDNPDVPRDASAAAVIASGLYELADYVSPEKSGHYSQVADSILAALTRNYRLPHETNGFILGHSTGHHPANSEIDVPLAYADYYYLEALLRKYRKLQ